jgi:uncharacterized membrane protein
MEPERIWHVVTNPAWRPFTEADVPGYVILLACAAALVVLTVWTYVGSAASTPKRIGILIALRLGALLLAILLALRPAAAITEIPKLPSTLLIVVDSSESMSVKDEANFTRWEAVRRVLDKCGPLLDQMRDDQQTTIYLYHFAKDFDPDRDKLTDDAKPDGKRTDFGTMLSKLYDRHQGERLLRGLIILSDGADNGTAKPALPEATRWRGIGCPVYTFVVGGPTSTDQKDIGFTSISPDPSPVAIKADLKVKAKLNAPGFEGRRTKIQLKINDEVKDTKDFELTKTTDNEIEMTTKAPDRPGEVKVSLELVDPPSNQVTTLNDKIETYLTVTREGVRVLVISKDGWELQGIRRALATDKRFDYVEAIRASEAPGTPEEARQFDLAAQRYDVIILGDVGPRMLTSVRPTILNEIGDLVRNKGVGLAMTGGAYSLAGIDGISDGWSGTPIADLLPVRLPARPPIAPAEIPLIKMVPTDSGLQQYVMKLDADRKKNQEAWDRLNTDYLRLQGFNEMGEPKERAAVLARVDDARNGKPLLVSWEVSDKEKGRVPARVMAFAASDTWRWTEPGPDPNNRALPRTLHDRFWKQMALWLAHQDEVEGNVYVRPEFRRLVVNGRQTIKMGVRDKRGDDIPEADIRYQILRPGETPDETKAKRAERDPNGGARVSFEAKVPDEYTVVAWGAGTDPTGEKVTGDAKARYVVYPEVSDEMLRPAANPEFLLALENTANGTAQDAARRADQLPKFLEQMRSNPPKLSTPRPKPYPDWRRDKQQWFLPAMLVLFVAVLGLEWGLRRAWGMV